MTWPTDGDSRQAIMRSVLHRFPVRHAGTITTSRTDKKSQWVRLVEGLREWRCAGLLLARVSYRPQRCMKCPMRAGSIKLETVLRKAVATQETAV